MGPACEAVGDGPELGGLAVRALAGASGCNALAGTARAAGGYVRRARLDGDRAVSDVRSALVRHACAARKSFHNQLTPPICFVWLPSRFPLWKRRLSSPNRMGNASYSNSCNDQQSRFCGPSHTVSSQIAKIGPAPIASLARGRHNIVLGMEIPALERRTLKLSGIITEY